MPSRAAALAAKQNLRETSSSPEPSPPSPPSPPPPPLQKRARARSSAKRPLPSRESSLLGGETGRKRKRKAIVRELEPTTNVIEILDSEDEVKSVALPTDPPEPPFIEFAEDTPRFTGEPVFVKIRLDGRLVESSDEGGLWWPAGVVERRSDGSCDVFLLAAVAPQISKHLSIPYSCLSQHVLRPMRIDKGLLSTNMHTYRELSDLSLFSASVAKRLDAAFTRGLEAMNKLEGDGDDDDGDSLPTISALLASSTSLPRATLVPIQEGPSVVQDPGPDRRLEIPGEHVLATQVKPKKITPTSEYWAARIEAYVPPTSNSEPPCYAVKFFDGALDKLQRSQFFTATDAQFATCALGAYESNDSVNDEATSISATPEPNSAQITPTIPPPPPEEFDGLSLRRQFAYIVPILQAILDNQYPPAQKLHDQFMLGGPSRAKLQQQAPNIGNLKTQTTQAIWVLINRWSCGEESNILIPDAVETEMDGSVLAISPASREGSTETEVFIDCPPPPSSLATSSGRTFSSEEFFPGDESFSTVSRPRGCEAYESLTNEERRQYCDTILHREGILQLLLWREGKRTALHLASAEVEESLHREAVALAGEADILSLVMELRNQQALKHRALTTQRSQALARTGSGTRSRPLR